ncbi:hypothetical protein R3P38DRAFT_3274706 [Favolaschia claudopus]|uniref:Uncharacterized protein n=1 Tax=Favolaschia claudopus TaxID=2862362 RepID=A0AAW0AZ65_9AGAR
MSGKHPSSKRRRSNSSANEPSSRSQKKSRGSGSASTSRSKGKGKGKGKGTGKKKGYRMAKKEVKDKQATGTQGAIRLHCRIMWGLFAQNSIPPPVLPATMAAFNARFSRDDDVDISAHIEDLVENAMPAGEKALAAVVDVQTKALLGRGQIALDTRRMEETHLQLIFNTIARAGLDRWAPDLFGPPESSYNVLHKQIALSTFQSVAKSFGYTHMKVNLNNLLSFNLLSKLYDSFVYNYMTEIARKEATSQGRVGREQMKAVVRNRRVTLADSRSQYLRNQGYRSELVQLAEDPDAHSDDELIPNVSPAKYAIYDKPGRSSLLCGLFRYADGQAKSHDQRSGVREMRTREEPNPSAGPSPWFKRHPENVPIDYFTPDYWNQELTVREKVEYMNNGIVLPLEAHCHSLDSITKWKSLSTDEFMKKFGNDKLALYNMPTEDELARLAEMDEEDEEDEVDEDLMDEDDESGSGSD